MARKIQKIYRGDSGNYNRNLTGKQLGQLINHQMKIDNSRNTLVEVGKGNKVRGTATVAHLTRAVGLRRVK